MDRRYRFLSLILISLAVGLIAYADQIAAQLPPGLVIVFGIIIFAIRELIKEYGTLKEDETA